MPSYVSTINRLRGEIARLDKEEAGIAKKEADLLKKANAAQNSISRTKSLVTVRSKQMELERISRLLAEAAQKKSVITARKATKHVELNAYISKQNKEDQRQQKKLVAEQARLKRESEIYSHDVTQQRIRPV